MIFKSSDPSKKFMDPTGAIYYPDSLGRISLPELYLEEALSAGLTPVDFSQVGVSAGMRAVLFGHSYLDQETDTFQPYNRPINYIRGTVNWANFLLGKPIRTIFSAGIGGERIRDWAKRFDTHVRPYAPHIVFISDPINDLKNTANPGYVADSRQVELPYVIAGYEQVILRCLDLGSLVIVMGCSVPNPAETNALGSRAARWNQWAARMSTKYKNVRFSPVHLATTDPASATGIALSGAYADSIHPGAANSLARGKILAKTLAPFVPEYGSRLIYTVGNTMGNQWVTVASFTVNGDGTATMVCANGTLGEIRTGDYCTFRNDTTIALNGTYKVLSHQVGASAVLTLACPLTSGSVSTGTMRATQCTQVFDNPLFLTTTGGTKSGAGSASITGNVPGSCTIANNDANILITVVDPSTTPYTDPTFGLGCGNWLTLDVTAASLVAQSQFELVMNASRASITASAVFGRMNGGAVYSPMIETEVVGASGGAGNASGIYQLGLYLNMLWTPTGGSQQTIQPWDGYRGSYTEAYPAGNFRGVFETPEFYVGPGSIDSCDMTLQVKVNPGASFRLRVARASCDTLWEDLIERGTWVNTPISAS